MGIYKTITPIMKNNSKRQIIPRLPAPKIPMR